MHTPIRQIAIFILTCAGFAWFPGVEALAQRHDRLIAGSSPGITGKVLGKVFLSGDYKKPVALKVFKSQSYCGVRVPNETLMVAGDGAVRNTVVTLRPLQSIAVVKPGSIVLDNSHCAFVPHIQVATLDSEVILKNSDRILHTVHARMGQETLFNVGLPRWRQVVKRLEHTGVVKIDCDVLHTWMSAAIVVVSTPYYSVTDENGFFSIDGLPTGTYEMETWHEKLGTKTTRISIEGNSEISLDIVYASRRKLP
ncbi:MAG: carboxypeptidase regulatory-like domain-containing protein [Candidatus Binatia bacterium]